MNGGISNTATGSDLDATVAIPATPFEYRLAPGRTALVVIDMQRDFVEPGGFGASLGNDVTQLHAATEPA